MANLLKKISPKTVCGDMKIITAHMLVNKEHTKQIMRVFGVAKDTKITEDKDTGKFSTGFKGSFKAINTITGEEFRAGICYVPGAGGAALEGVVGAESNVEFGFDVYVTLDANSAVGYTYDVKSLIEPGENDPLNAMGAKLPPLKALPAPTPVQAPSAEPAPEPVKEPAPEKVKK